MALKLKLIHTSIHRFSKRFKSTLTADYNYLEKNILPTSTFEKSLPRLAIPPLKDTCSRYLEALEPIIADANQFQNTVNLVKEFERNDGAKLHNLLVEQDKLNKHTSYISEPWFDMYLSSRLALPLNFNPFLHWERDPEPEFNDPVIRSSNLVINGLRFKRSLSENVLGPEVYHMNPKKSDTNFYRRVIKLSPSSFSWYISALFKAFPLDMSQYKNLFNSTRIPRLAKDEIKLFPESKHIVVMKDGKFFSFDVLDDSGNIKSPEYIYSCLNHIWNLPQTWDLNTIAVFTTQNRDTWATNREKLISRQVNAQNLNVIDSAIFLLCFDQVNYNSNNPDEFELQKVNNFLHGCCSKSDKSQPLNKWFDKSISIVIDQKGEAALNFEHSWGDGVAVLRFCTDIYSHSFKQRFVTSSTTQLSIGDCVKELTFDLDNQLREELTKADQEYRKTVNNLELNLCRYRKMNRNYFKNKKIGPDAMVQLAFQLAYYKLTNGKTATTYESCSTAAFKHGRTETLRPATKFTKKACQMIDSKTGQYSDNDLIQILMECSKKHSELTKNAAMGKGFDRHLFALKYLSNQRGLPLPKLFADQSYLETNNYTLSTSTLASECISSGGFGPVTIDGYGLAYGFSNNIVGLICSSYASHSKGKQFVQAVEQALDQIFEILEKKKD